MKKTKKIKSQDSSQTAYMEILKSLRNAISADYSYAIPKEKRAVILAYD